MKKKNVFLILFAFVLLSTQAQTNKVSDDGVFSALKMRNIGPAFTSGRIADIAINPLNENIWYVAVGSGGVWKTENAGTTWKPIFDHQNSYSIGCLTIDPNNSETIWVGTGENVSGRHVGFGDGVYKSEDGGKTWKNMGLKTSEHISKIIVHPRNPDIIWVAAQGPLWNSGGERGVYKSIDGGKHWTKTLGVNAWTGATDIALDPTNPDWIYAATWQRHRTVAALLDGGPGSGIYRSKDGGNSWKKMTTGLPHSNLGKIGIAVSPQHPEVVYAAIETDRRHGGFYKSTNKGASWEKQSNTVSGATGPHYYQELYASPHAFNRVYLMDVRIQVSDDGGKTFRILKENKKHSDNHVIAFKADDPNYLLVGSDGGIFESFDLAQNWHFIPNLPITQYYKLSLNNREPFYQIFGGTQDNGSHAGPSRTVNRKGITNADWFKTLGADGYSSAADPLNPDIIYGEFQEGYLFRVDLKTGDQVLIQPQAAPGEPVERYNWDAPIEISPYNPEHLYFASQRLWYSEDRGDSWKAISGDLSRNEERLDLPIMGKKQSWDNAWDVYAMSNYNNITAISVSPTQKGLIYVGTDDGLLQITQNGGKDWRKIDVSDLPDVPERAFVNDIKADAFDSNVVYLAVDAHKLGNFSPFLFKSTNQGKTWKSILGNLPKRTIVWRLVQDPVKKDMLFIGTEFGIYFTLDGGVKWHKMAGTPNIAFRDLKIQKRENDLVGASFGRGFFVLDDYSALREMNPETMKKEASLFPVRKTWWYIPRSGSGNIAAGEYVAKNPDFGAEFTYYLAQSYPTLKSIRQKKEKALTKANKGIDFPGWDALEKERNQQAAVIWLSIKNADGQVIRKIKAPARKGLNRVAWDLRYANNRAIDPDRQAQAGRWYRGGYFAVPGTYSVSLSKEVDGQVSPLAGPISFEVVALQQPTLKGASKEEYLAYMQSVSKLQSAYAKLNNQMNDGVKRLKALHTALDRAAIEPGDLNTKLYQLEAEFQKLDLSVNGYKTKDEIGEKNRPSVIGFIRFASQGLSSSYGPTKMHRENLKLAGQMLDKLQLKIDNLVNVKLPELEKQIEKAGAPVIL